MKVISLLILTAGILLPSDTLHVFEKNWSVVNAADWKVDNTNGDAVLQLANSRGPLPGPRRPIQFAIADTPDFSKVTLNMDVKPLQRSLIIVFNYHDAAHFDYAHLSTDTGLTQPVHNGIFHVYGGERVRISSPEGPAAFSESGRWYRVQLIADGETGNVQVHVDGTAVPALRGVDLSLRGGKVGIGSFDETGEFKNVKITGTTMAPAEVR